MVKSGISNKLRKQLKTARKLDNRSRAMAKVIKARERYEMLKGKM